MMNITFGITGGIACGKSTVDKTFIANDIPIVDADLVSREIVKLGSPGLAAIVENFGPEFLEKDQTLNRKKLGSLVFAQKEKRELLNILLAPFLKEESEKQISKLHNDGNRIVGYDAALLVETQLHLKYNPLVVVYCPKSIQLTRLMKRNNLSQQEAENRIASQISNKERLMVADYMIDTSGTIEESVKQTIEIIQDLKLMR